MIKITKKNLKRYFDNPSGNLYYFNEQDHLWHVLDGFSLEDCKTALSTGVEFVYITGHVTQTAVDNLLTLVLRK